MPSSLRFLLASALVVVPLLADASTVTVSLQSGDITGQKSPEFEAFRGIPFAEKPLGKLRFAPPVPAKPWKPSTLDATKYKHNCMQKSKFTPGQPRDTVDEDCLYLVS